jgi:hypothetical protein
MMKKNFEGGVHRKTLRDKIIGGMSLSHSRVWLNFPHLKRGEKRRILYA